MPSVALHDWLTSRLVRLNEIEQAHQGIGGTGPGRRHATLQVNQAYAVLLSAQFQGFCRDLYTESMLALIKPISQPALRQTLKEEFSLHRKLDRGNPNPGNIGSDFNRLGLEFWKAVELVDSRNSQRKRSLEELNTWRNAIAHQDFDSSALGGSTVLRLSQVRAWRSICDALAGSFDRAMETFLAQTTGNNPW